MGNPTPSLVAETEALREAYAALNRNDIPAMVTAFDPDIEWTEPDDYPGGGTHRGVAAVMAVVATRYGLPGGVAIAAGIVSGAAIGLIHGTWITRFGVSRLIT